MCAWCVYDHVCVDIPFTLDTLWCRLRHTICVCVCVVRVWCVCTYLLPLTPSGVGFSAPQTVMALCGMEVASTCVKHPGFFAIFNSVMYMIKCTCNQWPPKWTLVQKMRHKLEWLPVADPGFPVRGRGLPRRLRFKNFVCRNERMWSLRGSVRRARPLDLPMVTIRANGLSFRVVIPRITL